MSANKKLHGCPDWMDPKYNGCVEWGENGFRMDFSSLRPPWMDHAGTISMRGMPMEEEPAKEKARLPRVKWDVKRTENPHYYDEALEKIQEKGFDRFPTSREVMALIMADIEGTLNEKLYVAHVVKDLYKKDSEFFCQAFEVDYPILKVYERVTSLVWVRNLGHYERPSDPLWYSGVQEFNIDGLSRGCWNFLPDVNAICPELIDKVYGRPYEDLPDCRQNTRLWIPTCYPTPLAYEGVNDAYRVLDVAPGYRTYARGVKDINP